MGLPRANWKDPTSGSSIVYDVEIRDLAGRTNSCGCIDHRVGGLGTLPTLIALWPGGGSVAPDGVLRLTEAAGRIVAAI